MTLSMQEKLARHIMRLLKVRTVSFTVGTTERGTLSLKYIKDEPYYQMVLDAVPLSTKSIIDDENNIELKKLLEAYLFESDIDIENNIEVVE